MAGQVSAMLRLLQMGPFRVLTTFPVQFQSSRQLSLLELPPCRNTVTPSSDSSYMYTSTVQSGPPSTDAALTRHRRLQTSYPPSVHYISPFSAPPPPSLAPGRPSSSPASSPLPDSLRVLQWNAGGLRARSTELLHFLSSHPVDLICIQESNLSSSSSFRIPGFSALRSDRTHSRSGILTPDTTHASGGVVIFVRQGLSFSELSTSSLSLLDPYSDHVGVNISFNNSSLVSFFNVYAPLFAPPQRMADPIPFLPQFFPPEISSFWGTSIAITPFGTQEVLPTPAGKKYLTGSSPLTSSPSMNLTHPLFSIAPLAVAPLLTFPLLLLLLPFVAPWRCYRTLVLTIYQSFYLSLSLRSFTPTSAPLSFNFQKARWDGFASYFDSHCPSAEEYSSLSLFSAAALFTSLALNAAESSIPFGRIKRPPKSWWSAEVEEAVSERRKALAAAHRSDEDRQAYVSASRRASSVIAKAKAEAWQTTCTCVSPRSNPKSVHSLLRSIAGSSLQTFPTVLLPGNRLGSMPLT